MIIVGGFFVIHFEILREDATDFRRFGKRLFAMEGAYSRQKTA